MTEFEKCIAIVLEFEGGLVDDRRDGGGLTKYGISKNSFPDIDITNLTLEKAKQIYYTNYWLKANCDKLPWPTNLMFLDFAVNSGLSRITDVVIMLQQKLGTTVDGKLGPQTLASIQLSKPSQISKWVLMHRVQFVCNIIKNRPAQVAFLNGWMSRLFKLAFIIGNV